MKHLTIIASIILSSFITKGQRSRDSTESTQPNVQITFIYPIGSGGTHSINETYDVSVNFLGGATGGINGLEFSGFAGFTKGNVQGAQIAGFANIVTDTFRGLQAAGFSNVVRNDFEGIQLSGFANTSIKRHTGGQVAGFVNYVGDTMSGAQVSGFANATMGAVHGVQGAGFANYSMGLVGAQISGFVNTNVGDLEGNQVAGFVNVSTGYTQGLQLSGFINVANKMKGAQIGFINIADTLEGVAIGFLSYSRNGYHQFELSANETFQSNLAFKTGSNYFYNVFSAGVHWNKDNPVWALGYGIGTRKEFANKFSFNAELNSYSVLPDDFEANEWESLNKLKFSFAKGLGSHIEVFGGVSVNMWLSENETPKHEYLSSNKYKGSNGSVNWIMYPGYQFGIRI
ncbi:MAG: hypothetical protein ACI9JN_001077 [Bacteroidia bacterium]|jgi:hypothetical protein